MLFKRGVPLSIIRETTNPIKPPSGSYLDLPPEHSGQKNNQDFPGGPVDKNPSANAGDMGSIPDPGRFHILRSNY